MLRKPVIKFKKANTLNAFQALEGKVSDRFSWIKDVRFSLGGCSSLYPKQQIHFQFRDRSFAVRLKKKYLVWHFIFSRSSTQNAKHLTSQWREPPGLVVGWLFVWRHLMINVQNIPSGIYVLSQSKIYWNGCYTGQRKKIIGPQNFVWTFDD